jgi:hypothetical protein
MATRSVPDGMLLVQEIEAYGVDARDGKICPTLDHCPRCESRVEGPWYFRRHERRPRSFLVIAAEMVRQVHSWITRWKCILCKLTFTWYPPFALPRKRYTLPQMLDRGQHYVEADEMSYRNGVFLRGMPIFHEQKEDEEITGDSTEEEKEKEEPRAFAHSTLYRWVSAFGALRDTARRACDLIKQRDPATSLFRQVGSFRVAPRKHRSPERRSILYRCRRLCIAEAVYAETFGLSIFPRLGTVCRWT